MERKEIKQSVLRQLGLTLAAAFMTFLSIFIITTPGVTVKVIGWLGAVFFGLCFVFIFSRLIRPKAVLILNADGFTELVMLL